MRSLQERDELIWQFQHLPRHVALSFWKRINLRRRLDTFDDAVQIANMALVRAAAMYDQAKSGGASFKTYAFTAIRNALINETHRHGLIHVPVRSLKNSVKRFRRLGNREKALAAQARYVQAMNRSCGMVLLDNGSLQKQAIVNGDSDAAGSRSSVDVMQQAVRRLPAKQRRLVRKRFGLGRDRTHSLAEIARAEGISRERVRQKVGDAIMILRDCLLQIENP